MVMCFMAFAGISNAQPPKPGVEPTSDNRNQYSINRAQGPIGTATCLLIGLAGGCIAYKLKRNTKKPQE